MQTKLCKEGLYYMPDSCGTVSFLGYNALLFMSGSLAWCGTHLPLDVPAERGSRPRTGSCLVHAACAEPGWGDAGSGGFTIWRRRCGRPLPAGAASPQSAGRTTGSGAAQLPEGCIGAPLPTFTHASQSAPASHFHLCSHFHFHFTPDDMPKTTPSSIH